MSKVLNEIKNFTKSVGTGIVELFKKKDMKPIKLEELASLIMHHKDKKETITLLGLVFNTYILMLGPTKIKLETKGKNDEYILELSVSEHGRRLFSYKSYEDGHSLKAKQLLPEYVHLYLNQASS